MGESAWAGVLVVIASFLQTCSTAAAAEWGRGALVRLTEAELPRFRDDLMFAGLAEALMRQRSARETGEKVVLGGTDYSAAHVRESAQRLQHLVQNVQGCLRERENGPDREGCFSAFQRAISSEFAVYAIRSPAQLTAYYTPTIDVSREPNAEFRFPIYAHPESHRLRRLARKSIDFRGGLAGRGLELFYARSRFDIYVLHVEGGGRVRIRSNDGVRTAYLSYAGDNGRRFRPIERYMLRRKMLHKDDVSRYAQREYLRTHPQQAERVFASCPWFVFFRETYEPVLGSAGATLTANRSLASDTAHYRVKGLIAFVAAALPLLPDPPPPLESNPTGLQYRQMTRFFVDQDQGPSIKGVKRFDLFFGEGDYAEFLANNLYTQGRVYFLVLKQRPG